MAGGIRLSEDAARAIIDRMTRISGRNPVASSCGAGALDTAAVAAAAIAATGAPKKKGRPRGGVSDLEHMFAGQLTTLEIPPPRREYEFMPNRGFRLDYAWPDRKLAVEVNGMVHRIKERFLRDTEKVAYALIHGWIVLPISGDDVRSGRGVSWLITLWELRGK